MKDVNININMDNIFETFVCGLMTSYRWIPLLATLASNETRDDLRMIAWLDAVKLIEELGMPPYMTQAFENDLRSFINKNKNWINYTMADFWWYAHNMLPLELPLESTVGKDWNDYRMSLYHDRMQDQFDFLEWNKEAFKEINFEGCGELEILDIGCGTMPYLELFRKANMPKDGPPSLISGYTGVDKRAIHQDRFDEIKENYPDDSLMVRFYLSNMFKEFPVNCEKSFLTHIKAVQPNVLFLGEALHCVDRPRHFLSALLRKLIKVKRISILEPHLGTVKGLSQAFPFHMKLHANGLFVNCKTLSCMATNLGFNLHVVKASSQHTMYHLTKI